MENYYKKQWINLLNNNFFPSYFRKIQTIEFTEFKKIIMGMNNESEKLLKNVFLGDALVIKKVFDKKNLVKLRNNIYNIQKNEEEKNLRMLENCPNFHVSNKKK